MKQKTWVRIVATLALLGIVISIIGTWILLIFNSRSGPAEATPLTPEQRLELENMMNSQTGSISSLSGSISFPDTLEITNSGASK